MLKVSHLCYSYKQEIIFQDASFIAFPGKITIILGRSGVGKTTLFRLLSGLLTPEQGSCLLWKDRTLTQNSVAYMQQKEALLPWRTALKNILLPTELGSPKQAPVCSDYLQKVIKNFNLSSLLNRYPDELSGGQRQRVALASQYLSQKPILLLDEPFSSLDILLKEQLYKDVVYLAKNENKTVILVTHDFRDVLFLGDSLFIIKNHQLVSLPIDESIKSPHTNQNFLDNLKKLLSS
ncbi:ABC transporter ATP-binding protein [Chlamydia sp. 17-3921]|uniref:ABC transporter ATP-binding protein n=1 Tax=Chlamydia sp. 17-3921 TaxID=2675798 RepID=UPI001918213E|nr:ABC transporter ATP-binding protein [Chlamydia sp. 17-3921]